MLKLVPLQRQRFCGQRLDGQAFETRIPVPFSSSISLGMLEYEKTEEKSVDITWDEKKVTVLGVTLYFKGHYSTWFPPKSGLGLELYMKDEFGQYHLLIARDWKIGEECTWKSGESGTAGALLINGRNTFKIRVYVPHGSWGNASVDGISVEVVYYSNIKPTVKYPEPEWLTYVKWGAIGAVIIGGVYLGIRAYEARKKKG